jgi:hypothetical protein
MIEVVVLFSSSTDPYRFSWHCIWGIPGGCALSSAYRDHRGRGVRGPASV